MNLPWCDGCSKFWNPPELSSEGNCPGCGRAFTGTPKRGAVAPALPSGQAGPTEDVPAPGPSSQAAKAKGAPWHFKLLVAGVTVYMVYRIYWLVEWLPKHI